MFTLQCIFLLVFSTLHNHIQAAYVRELTDRDFEKAVSKDLALVNFYTNTCPQCQQFRRTFEKAAEIMNGLFPSVSVAQINCEEEGVTTCWKYFITDFPTVLLFTDGIPTEDFKGDRTEEGIIDFIEEKAPPPKDISKLMKGLPKQDRTVPKVSKVVHGHWGEWADYGPCSRSCGQGIKRRKRECNNPSPQRGGEYCRGRQYEDQRCNSHRCLDKTVRRAPKVHGNWGEWSAYQPCSRTCGKGTQRRTRKCDNPAPKNGGFYCQGMPDEDRRCNTQRCVRRVDGNWSSWSKYGYCSRTCDGGSQLYIRFCNNPPPSDGGPTAINGGWGQWSNFGTCSKTCGTGIERRSRVCNDPRPSAGGRPCVGPGTDQRSCNTKPCRKATNGNWGQWSSYGPCSKTCGTGIEKRSRLCNDPRPSAGGQPCAGPVDEERPCNTNSCTDACLPCSCRGDNMDCHKLSLESVPQNIPSHIKNLDLSQNNINDIPESAFARNSKLRVLNLGENRIKQLSRTVLEPLESIKIISLKKNKLTEVVPGTFYGFFYLESIDLSHNNLKTLPPGIFDRIKSLKHLSLQNNSITSLPQKVFDRLNLLEQLHLYSNRLTHLQNDLFDNLSSLQNLTLHQNKLSKLQNGVFSGLKDLKSLNLNNNSIATVEEEALNGLTELRMLDMTDNSISSLPPGFLFPLTGNIRNVKLFKNPLACTCQLFMESESLKDKIGGTCNGKVPIFSMSVDQYCGELFVQ